MSTATGNLRRQVTIILETIATFLEGVSVIFKPGADVDESLLKLSELKTMSALVITDALAPLDRANDPKLRARAELISALWQTLLYLCRTARQSDVPTFSWELYQALGDIAKFARDGDEDKALQALSGVTSILDDPEQLEVTRTTYSAAMTNNPTKALLSQVMSNFHPMTQSCLGVLAGLIGIRRFLATLPVE